MRWAHTSRVNPTSRRYFNGAQPIGARATPACRSRPEGHGQVAHRRRRPPPAFHGLGPDLGQAVLQLLIGQVGALSHLDLVDPVDPVVCVDLLVERDAASELVQQLADRRLPLTRAEDVQRHRPHVPAGAVGRSSELLVGQVGDEARVAGELLFGEAPRLGPRDPFRKHRRSIARPTAVVSQNVYR